MTGRFNKMQPSPRFPNKTFKLSSEINCFDERSYHYRN